MFIVASILLLDPPWKTRCTIIVFTEMSLFVSHETQNLFLKIGAPHKGPSETCYLARYYLELLQLKGTHSNKQIIHWVPGTRLLSFKHHETKHSFSNSNCPTSQDKKSQLFLIVKWVHNLSILLVWKGLETSHHVGEECQKFRATFHEILASGRQSALQYFQCHTSSLFLFRMMIKLMVRNIW